jgi:uncharacterized protein YqjF (DUF2071 family)
MKNFLRAEWQQIIMANYEVPDSILLPYLPAGVELDKFYGKSYVSLVGFKFSSTRLFNIPIPLLGTFEEINLRFYVKRYDNGKLKRGVVFINETVPYTLVAWVANFLYKEHYVAVKTKHHWAFFENSKQINYYWKIKGNWNHIAVNANVQPSRMQAGSFEEFIFEHYFGYTKIDNTTTEEYCIHHQRWEINSINEVDIQCDFGAMYGNDFEFLNSIKPSDVFLTNGSAVAVDWKRNRYKM